MDYDELKLLLESVKNGKVSVESAAADLKRLPFSDLGHTKVDHHRALRQGASEVVFAEGKKTADILAIITEMKKHEAETLLTRVSEDQAKAIKKKFPGAAHNPVARTVRVKGKKGRKKKEKLGPVAVISAGTSDAPVIEEAKETLDWLGIEIESVTDAGVAGVHRLLAHHEVLDRARAIIVVAGMEGALTSVVGGLVSKPVIGVPTSVGYGAGAGGIAALLGMLNSCASGVTVVNIDNGFGAACAAARILRACREQA